MTARTLRRLGALALAGTATLAGCDLMTGIADSVSGSGRLVEEPRDARGATAVVLDAPGDLLIDQGSREGLVVEAEDNLIRSIRTRVEGGVLRIEVEPGVSVRPTRPIRYHLTVRDLERLVLAGSGSAELFALDVGRLHATLAGSGGLLLDDLFADTLELAVDGSGAVIATGNVGALTATLGGSGDIDARTLRSRSAQLSIGGSGSAYVRVRDWLDARIGGSGSIFYWGNPQVTRSGSGSGSVRRMGS